MLDALIIALTYYVCQIIDAILGFQAMTRPIVMGSVVGLVCGDLETGVILGAAIEALYMGISGIGGIQPADYRSAVVVAVGLTILSGISVEQGLTIAVTIGVLGNTVDPITALVVNSIQPISIRYAEEGNYKKFRFMMIFEMLFIKNTLSPILVFLCCAFGTEAVSTLFSVIPAWVLAGLSAAGGMLIVIGLCLTTQAIYSKSTPIYVLLGFVLVKYLGLTTLPIAIIGIIIAFIGFNRDYKLKELENKLALSGEGDDFYE
ncbi:PTS mannose/fructose/sorbose/N-acetylgalactosamine transporter subunit IIC [Dielma fastidiosa]|uniref:PTS mannose/fructose/sorbose/N-acetylgalactosamine transporter subunit IIC n=1 Tax=Dielma fastidiosa TaxID=1034346 RepID=UPI0023F591C0|nr:PTS sugar transporter subunit IIC [Dielma fastidiosa]